MQTFKFMNESVDVYSPQGAPSGGVDVTGSRGTEVAVARPTIAPVATPVSPATTATVPTTSSTDFRNQINRLYGSVQDAKANVPGIWDTAGMISSATDTTKIYDDYRTKLAQRRDQEIKSINESYDTAKYDLGQAQTNETGVQSMGLARIGGFDSASGQNLLVKLDQSHRREQAALMAKRDAAIRAAENAYTDKDFELLSKKQAEIRQIDQDIYSRQKDFADYVLKLQDNERADLQMQQQQAEFDYKKKRDLLADQEAARTFAYDKNISTPFYVMGGIGYDTSTGEALSYDEYIARGGSPDFSNAMTVDPNSEMERDYIVKLAQAYPDAPIDPFRDSLQAARDKIKQSRIYAKEVYIAPRDTPDTPEKVLRGDFIAGAEEYFRDSKGKDGKVNPDEYRSAMNEFIRNGYGGRDDFFQEFPPSLWIAPENLVGDLSLEYEVPHQKPKPKVSNDNPFASTLGVTKSNP